MLLNNFADVRRKLGHFEESYDLYSNISFCSFHSHPYFIVTCFTSESSFDRRSNEGKRTC